MLLGRINKNYPVLSSNTPSYLEVNPATANNNIHGGVKHQGLLLVSDNSNEIQELSNSCRAPNKE